MQKRFYLGILIVIILALSIYALPKETRFYSWNFENESNYYFNSSLVDFVNGYAKLKPVVKARSLNINNITLDEVNKTVYNDFENSSGWQLRDGNWDFTRDCNISYKGLCSLKIYDKDGGMGSLFVYRNSFNSSRKIIEFYYKCQKDARFGFMIFNGSWKCIQGSGNANCGAGFANIGKFKPDIICDGTWRYAYYSFDENNINTSINELIIGDWQTSNLSNTNKSIWIDEFKIRDKYKNKNYETGWFTLGNETVFDRIYYDFNQEGNNSVKVDLISASINVSFMEFGKVKVGGEWKKVYTLNKYNNAVIVASPKESTDIPLSVRIRNVSNDSFEIKLENPNGSVGIEEDVYYLVVEKGIHNFNGIKIEAGKKFVSNVIGSLSGDNTWDYVSFSTRFNSTPIVFSQVMTAYDERWITEAIKNVNETGFNLALEAGQVNYASNKHSGEIIGWVAIDANKTIISEGVKFETGIYSNVRGHDNGCFNKNFINNYSTAIAISDMQTREGSDGGWSVICGLTNNNIGTHVEEDQAYDSERSHIGETIGFIIFEKINEKNSSYELLEGTNFVEINPIHNNDNRLKIVVNITTDGVSYANVSFLNITYSVKQYKPANVSTKDFYDFYLDKYLDLDFNDSSIYYNESGDYDYASVYANATAYALGGAEHLIDEDETINGNDYFGYCYWPCNLSIVLNKTVYINKIYIHFWDGDGRYYNYSLYVSKDGFNWTRIVNNNYVHGKVNVTFNALPIKYINIEGLANTANNGFHVIEVDAFGAKKKSKLRYYYSVDSGNSWHVLNDFNLSSINSSSKKISFKVELKDKNDSIDYIKLKYSRFEETCSDGIKNRDEEAVDCGGLYCALCPESFGWWNKSYKYRIAAKVVTDNESLVNAIASVKLDLKELNVKNNSFIVVENNIAKNTEAIVNNSHEELSYHDGNAEVTTIGFHQYGIKQIFNMSNLYNEYNVSFYIKKIGNPSGNFVFYICNKSYTINMNSINNEFSWVTKEINNDCNNSIIEVIIPRRFEWNADNTVLFALDANNPKGMTYYSVDNNIYALYNYNILMNISGKNVNVFHIKWLVDGAMNKYFTRFSYIYFDDEEENNYTNLGSANINGIVSGEVEIYSEEEKPISGGASGGGGGGTRNIVREIQKTPSGISIWNISQEMKTNESIGKKYYLIKGWNKINIDEDVYMFEIYSEKESFVNLLVKPIMNFSNPLDDVYKYYNISIRSNVNLTNITIFFKVPNDWLIKNNYTDIVLIHFNRKTLKWEEINTTFLNKDEKFSYYKASLKNFSVFAIKGVKAKAIEEEKNIPKKYEKTKKSKIYIIISLVIIILISLIIYNKYKRFDYRKSLEKIKKKMHEAMMKEKELKEEITKLKHKEEKTKRIINEIKKSENKIKKLKERRSELIKKIKEEINKQ